MAFAPSKGSTIVQTERGLTISGTRITLYDVMGSIKAECPFEEICENFGLTSAQLNTALDYIKEHQAEVEAEYQEVIQSAEANRQYWEEGNRERFAQIAALPPQPGQEELRQKLQAWKDRLEA
jgi:uncharacterized protein (DUF433 family)